MSGLWLMAARWILIFVFKEQHDYFLFLTRSLPVRFGIAFLLIACMAMISMVWYTFEEQKENEKRKNETEKLTKEAELYKLRQQLQPHFLFNSLNSISALIGSNPEHARTMIQQLSDFLRSTLKKEEQQWVSVNEELHYLELYLAIEKVRFGHRLSTMIQSDESSGLLKLPNMLLQPIVENAIKFSIYDTTGDITIRINVVTSDHELLISVQNPFDPETSQSLHGTGFGLSSVQRRLQLLFARNDLLKTTIQDNQFMTTVIIPQQL
jgi:LytS/YehU family sensor histidine kinase